MNNKQTIGIVGGGIVGIATAHSFITYNEVMVYDIDAKKATHSFAETINQDIVFLCLPSPMTEKTGGPADLTIINDVVAKIADTERINKNTIFAIKSTVPINTTSELIIKYPRLKIIHNPEFLTSRTSIIDANLPTRIVLGDDSNNHIYAAIVAKLYKSRFPSVPCYTMSTMESEMVKYMCNTFFATKIMFFNEMKMLCDKMGLNWNIILDGMLSCGKIALSHTNVGQGDAAGFGGACFSKDINALIASFEKEGLDPKVLKAVWEQNLAIRPKDKWDW